MYNQAKSWYFVMVFPFGASGQNLVPAQPKSGQSLRFSKIEVCHPAKQISGGEQCRRHSKINDVGQL
jgi:hypothetical protein